ncbi:type IV secretion system protein VirB10 [Ensifer sp. SL37]|uniref:type IV secretion system protein VirB10 n=1 Tax=Ensifer sp. SL37 TaxID=2995137 RepID=UPI00227263EF|nr:type IV secretion system protein VirB10 [Ensifer sp. SL37]MCY1740706.1 type IV secretion system protein VirB10 [Ensifer sp. SL37]
MTVDFEEEARICESVTQPGSGQRGKLLPVLLGASALGLLAYAVYVSFVKPEGLDRAEAQEEFKTASQSAQLNLDPESPPLPPDNKLVLTPPAEQPTVTAPTVVAVTAPVAVEPAIDEEAARRAREEAERVRRKEELRQARLRSNMIIVDQSVKTESGDTLTAGGSAGSATGVSADDDPNRKFVDAIGAQDVEKVTASRNERIDALIPQGTLIRGVLETAIQSDLPGMVRAVTSTDVYSFDGRRILLPKGTMLTGEYKSAVARGQTRVLIVWTRALSSDGTSVSLGSYGTDDLGRSGLTGFVDKHYLERFGAASVLSIVGGVSSYIAGLGSSGTSSSDGSDAQTQAQQTVAQTMSEMANMALQDSINIPPTIFVDQGAQIMVFVRRDLDFSALYPDPVKEAANELRRARAVSAGN